MRLSAKGTAVDIDLNRVLNSMRGMALTATPGRRVDFVNRSRVKFAGVNGVSQVPVKRDVDNPARTS
jgi:hypothetical protein